MVAKLIDAPRCRDCKEVIGDSLGSYVFCPWLNCTVYGGSLMCKHGKDLFEAF